MMNYYVLEYQVVADYVLNQVVTAWRVRPWHVVVGRDA